MKTGRRALALREVLTAVGIVPAAAGPAAPRLSLLPAETRDQIVELFHALGGSIASPHLRPGPWDLLCEGDVVVELDEELHFNRYRGVTLEPDWTTRLPWREDYVMLARERESACVAAARWGKRWTNPSSERLFGVANGPGEFAANGAPRWKQRALYDAMKDAAAAATDEFRLIRLSVYDNVGGTELGAALERRASLNLEALAGIIQARST